MTKSRLTVGIIGCEPGAGATHLAVALANLCGSKLKKKTALLELHKRNEFSRLINEEGLPCKQISTADSASFHIHDVDYYGNVLPENLPSLLNQGYHYLILDMGSVHEADLTEFLRCDKKLVIGSLAPWKADNYRIFIQTIYHNFNLGEGFCYLTRTSSPKKLRDFSDTYHLLVHHVPSIENPFYIKKELFSILQELLS